MPNHRSIILITVDSLRADRIGGSLTPNIERWAAGAVRLTGAVANGPHTSASFPSILGSRYLSHGGFSANTPSIAEVLKARGYRTAAFVAANPYISKWAGYAKGFDTFVDWMDARRSDVTEQFKGIAGTGGILRRALGTRRLPVLQFANGLLGRRKRPFPSGQTVVDEALKWVKFGSGPAFLWVHLMDLHYPYFSEDRPDEVSRLEYAAGLMRVLLGVPRGGVELMGRLYDLRVRDVDSVAGRLLKEIEGGSAGPDPIIAFTADHGEQFAERGGYAHPSSLFEEQLRVPLAIGGVGPVPAVLSGQFSLIDLSPTLLGLAGVQAPAEFEGRDHSAQIREKAPGDFAPRVISEAAHIGGGQIPVMFPGADSRGPGKMFWTFSLRSGKWKYIFDDEGQKERLFNLESDPCERENRVADETGQLHECREFLNVHRSGPSSLPGESGPVLSAAEAELVKRQLEDLGYL